MAISDKLTYLNETKNLLKTQINYGLPTEQQITSLTTFRNYVSSIFNAFLEALRTPDTLFTNLPKKSGSGAVISLNDTANAPMRIELGASELSQAGTPTPSSPQDIHTISGSNTIKVCGKNLLSGIEQGTLNSSGEPTYSSTAIRSINFDEVKPSTTYTVSINGTATNINVAQYDSNKNFISFTFYAGTFTTSATTKYIKITKGGSLTDLFQVELGTATTYEPYTSQEADIDLKSKNLINIGGDVATISNYYYTNRPLNFTITSDMVGKKLSLSYHIDITNFSSSASAMNSVLGYGATSFDTQLKLVSFDSVSAGSYNVKMENIEITSAMVDKQLYIRYLAFNQQSTATYNVKNVQLEYGETCTNYVEYYTPIQYCKIGNYEDKFIRNSGKNLFDGIFRQGSENTTTNTQNIFSKNNLLLEAGTYTFSTNLPMTSFKYAIGTSTTPFPASASYIDGFHTTSSFTFTLNQTSYVGILVNKNNTNMTPSDVSGYTFMLNEGTTALDYEPYGSNEWYIKKNIGKVVLDGTENWNKGGSTFFLDLSSSLYASSDNPMAYCNYFEKKFANEAGKMYFASKSRICFVVEDFANVSLQDWKDWLSTHNTEVYYPFEKITYTQITGTLAEQLENIYKNMLSQEGVTNISQINNDLSFNLSVLAIEK